MVIFGRFSALIAYFRDYEPMNVVFGANFIPYPKGLNTRDFLSQFWFVKILIPWTWGLWKGSKMVIFGRFSVEIGYFRDYEPLNVVFGAIFIPYPKGLYTRDFLTQFWSFKVSIPWTWGFWKGSKMVIFGGFSAKIAYFHNYEPLNVVFGANFIPYPKGLYTKDFLSQYWSFKFQSHGPGGSERGPKW